jgi:hypothetical protein
VRLCRNNFAAGIPTIQNFFDHPAIVSVFRNILWVHAVARQVGLRASELRGRRRAAAKRPAIQVQRLPARPAKFRFALLAPRQGG